MHTFLCSANDLLGLLEKIYGFRWTQAARVKKMPYLICGRFPIFSDGLPLQKDLETIIPDVMQRFNQLLDDIYYRNIAPEVASWSMSLRWRAAAECIFFGKEHGLSRNDWGEALRKKI